VEIMRAERGGHFDPGVLDAFFEDMDAVREIEKQPRRLDDPSGLPRGIVSVNRAPQGPEHPRWT
jgi:HD-GYP domain-containing protein (c-di-GMP phosphodiesterase class II)